MAQEKITLLVVEDNDADFRLVTEYLKESPLKLFEVGRAKRLSDAVKMVDGNKFDAALLDLDLPDSRGLSIIDNLRNHGQGIAVLVLTGMDDEKLGIEAVKRGAQDYLIKGRMYGGLLYRSIIYAIERKRAEDILQRDKDVLDKLVKGKTEELIAAHLELNNAKRLSDIGTLAATVAHELRNPLAAISMAAANIKRKANNPNLDKHLANIEKKVAESDQIINNLLFYSRIKPPAYESVNIYDIVTECIDSSKDRSKNKMVFENNLKGVKNLTIMADPLQFKEVMNNILNNAIDALPVTGGVVRVTADDEGGHAAISVIDNGAGIEKSHLERIFDPFFTTKAKGTGLGLSVCRQIIDFHGGSINITSEPGKGTAVTMRLPKKRG